MPVSKKIGIAVGALAVAALAAWWRLSPPVQESLQAAPSAVPLPSNSAPATAEAASTPQSAAETKTATTPSSEAAMQRPEDAIVAEPDDNSTEADQAKPSPEVIAGIRELKKPTADEGEVTINPDGSQKISLGNRYKSVPVATRDKDGKVRVNYHGEGYIEESTQKEKP
ncbi:MAG: hypothetical protein R3E61_03890 [Pseudomonadales bacterium]